MCSKEKGFLVGSSEHHWLAGHPSLYLWLCAGGDEGHPGGGQSWQGPQAGQGHENPESVQGKENSFNSFEEGE